MFNTDHLWLVRAAGFTPERGLPSYWQRRTFWNRFDPSFAAGVHSTIFDKALGDLIDASALSRVKRKSLWLDVNILTYDPCDHFDNAFLDQGWDKVNQRLAAFRSDNSDWESFGAAAHSIGDFCGSVPHHDEMAVDAATPGKKHKLYNGPSAGPTDRQAFANQFRWRVNTATQHIRRAFLQATGR